MAKLSIKPGSTSVSLYVFVGNSSVTTGAGLTGLTYNTASLVAYYVRPLGSAAAITLATQTVTGAWSSGGFVEVDATNMPGVYRFDVPDAVLATGVRSAVVMLKGAANMVPVVLEVDLNAEVNLTHWLGTAAATPSVAGVPEVDITHFNGTAGTFAAGRPETNVTHFAGTAYATALAAEIDAVWDEALSGHQTAGTAGRAALLSGTILSETTAAGTPTTTAMQLTAGSAVDNFYNDLEIIPVGGALTGQARIITGYVGATKTITVDEAWTSAMTAGDAVVIRARHAHSKNQIADVVWNAATASYGTAGTYGERIETNLDATVSSRLATSGYTAPLDAAGTRSAVGLAVANLDTQLIAIDDYLDTEVAAILAAVDTEVGAIKARTDLIPASPAATGDIPTTAQIATAVLTTAMTESYAADGTAPTLAQASFLTMQRMGEFGISGTTMTIKKLDGTTTAATYTLDSATTPTSITRAT